MPTNRLRHKHENGEHFGDVRLSHAKNLQYDTAENVLTVTPTFLLGSRVRKISKLVVANSNNREAAKPLAIDNTGTDVRKS